VREKEGKGTLATGVFNERFPVSGWGQELGISIVDMRNIKKKNQKKKLKVKG